VALNAYPFDQQAVSESQYSRLFREFQDSGVAASTDSSDLRVTADGGGMRVAVAPGFAILRGHAVHSTSITQLAIGPAGVAERHDRIVLRLDPAENSVVLAVLAGAPGGVAPEPSRTDTGIYELPLAIVRVAPNATNISATAVTDDRQFVGTRVGSWTTETRPGAPRIGQLGLNRSSNTWEFWSGSVWADLAPAVTWSAILSRPATFTPSAHTHGWEEVSGKPSTYPPTSHTHSWSQITGEPSTYPPSSHSHSWSSITSKPSSYPPSSHSHSQYLESGDTISWANGSKRPYSNTATDGTWYAVWVEGSGGFCRNTSARRFKKNIRSVDIDPTDVLELRPVIYDRRDQEQEDGTVKKGRRDEVGLIAEEVEAHLPWLVTYHEGQVDGLRYDLLGVALLPVVQDQAARIEALEHRLAALEGARD
jgi:hypothetical protein